MRTASATASLSVATSLALLAGFASASDALRPRTPMAAAGSTSGGDAGPGVVAQQARGSDCPAATSESWFAQTPRLIACAFNENPPLAVFPVGPADINGDGKAEFFQFFRSSILAVWNGAPYSGPNDGPSSGYISISSLVSAGGAYQAKEMRVQIFDSSIGNWCLANLPAPAAPNRMVSVYLYGQIPDGNASWSGWRDIDGDGDLDFVCRATDEATWNAQIWFENIGNERPSPPVAADLNGDGRVDGEDLGRLLASWGPNP